ncbi:MAG: FAD-dependent monooxygenase [Gammaproteobacteria bacterium]
MSTRVLVVGGSVAGVCAAALLARHGVEVTILERSGEDLAGRGAGIAIHRDLFEVLAALGLDAGTAVGVHARGRQLFAADGRVVEQFAQPQVFTSWGLVYRMLRGACAARYCKGKVVTDVQQHAAGVQVGCADGTWHEADWLIGADGSRSTLRAQVAPSARLRYAGYVAWRGLVLENALDGEVRAALEHRMSFALPHGEHLLCYLVAGPEDDLRPGQRWYNWVWYRPVGGGAPLEDLLTAADGTHHPDGIPPALIRDTHVGGMRDAAERLLPPVLGAVVAATPRPFLQAIVDGRAERLRQGRVLLIGDAACTARPHVGLGVSKAAGDARELGDIFALADPTRRESALTAWEQRRLAFGHAALTWGRRLGAHIGAPQAADARNAGAAAHLAPNTIIREVASPHPERYLTGDTTSVD